MKKLTLLLSVLLVAGVASAAQTAAPATKAKSTAPDATAKTLTIKGEPNKTVPVDATAAATLKNLKAGEKVKLTCRDNDKGEHEAITHITVEKEKKQ
jgi:uncharacterized protein YcfL